MTKLIKHTQKRGRLSWKNHQKSGDIKKNFTFGITVLILLACLILVSKLVSFIQNFNNPYRPDGNELSKKEFFWDGSSNINLVIQAEQVYLLSFIYPEKSLTLFKIPENTYLNLPFSFGRWPVRSVYSLGQGENPPVGAALLKDTLSLNLGLPVQGYLILPEEDLFLSLLDKKQGDIFTSLDFFQTVKTDLSFRETVQFLTTLRGIRQDKVNRVDLSSSSLTSFSSLADGSKVLGINQAKLDKFVQDKLADNKIEEEGLTIGIFNTTEHIGLGEKASRVINNLGGRVIFTANLPDKFEKTVVLGKRSYTQKRLSEIFAATCVDQERCVKIVCQTLFLGKKCQLEDLAEELSRAEVSVFLGEDYFNRYQKSP